MPDEMAGKLQQISGTSKVAEWFGYWPSFHDAEVLGIQLARNGTSKLDIYYYEGRREKEPGAPFVVSKEAVISFLMEGISDLRLEGFSHQNVIFDLIINVMPDGFRLDLGDTFGIAGFIECKELRVELRPNQETKP